MGSGFVIVLLGVNGSWRHSLRETDLAADFFVVIDRAVAHGLGQIQENHARRSGEDACAGGGIDVSEDGALSGDEVVEVDVGDLKVPLFLAPVAGRREPPAG